jgi:hypothetical protein
MIKKTHAILDEYLHLQDIKVSCQEFYRGRHGRDRMIVGFTTTYAELQIKKKNCQTLGPASKRVLPDLSTFCQTYFFLEIF